MPRHFSIDLLRGFIMILMALDHASLMVGRVHFSEFWGVDFVGYPDGLWWLTRFLSHLCAPGFFFLMGMSILFFGEKAKARAWSTAKIRNYFLKRGGMILLLMFLLEIPAFGIAGATSQAVVTQTMPGHFEGGIPFPGTVLFGLGICMILCSVLWELGKGWWLFVSLFSFGISGWVIALSDPHGAFDPLLHLLIVPGMSNGAMSLYPVLPWLGVTTFGIFWAKLMQEQPAQFYRISLQTGSAFIGAFFLFRVLEIGNFHFEEYESVIDFFTLIKYPPSLTFILLTLGINLVLLQVFSKSFGRSWLKPVLIFGQTAMFFYILHLWFYALIGIAFPLGAPRVLMYLIWIVVLVPLYFLGKWYLKFKRKKSRNSIWRMI